MSKENVKLFYEAVAKDKALQEKYNAMGKQYAGQKLDDARADSIYQQELIPMAKSAGYDFNLADLKAYAEETKKPAMREVSEEELAKVAGGATCVCVLAGYGNVNPDYPCSCALYGTGGGPDQYCMCVMGGGGGT